MADFKLSYLKVMDHEGGYVNHPNDRGGETYKGIARKRNPNWKGWPIIDSIKGTNKFELKLDNDELLQMEVRNYYKLNYWDSLNLDYVKAQAVADEVFDISVNMGPGTAGSTLQQALNLLNRNQKDFPDLPTTGTVGPQTLKTINLYNNEAALVKTLNGIQFGKYRNICQADPSQEVFFLGWLKRT